MEYEYLKKEKLYQIVQALVGEELPSSQDFGYTAFMGAEWLEYHDWKVTSLRVGDWICIHHQVYGDGLHEDKSHIETDIYTTQNDGNYLYHWHNGSLENFNPKSVNLPSLDVPDKAKQQHLAVRKRCKSR